MPPSLGLDHVYIRVSDLDATLSFFHLQLGLPVSWPTRDEAFARYAWVNAGNVQLELWEARSNEDLPPGSALPFAAGLALWPRNVHASRRLLESVGVRCKEPREWRTPVAGGEGLNFTNCLVLDATGPACQVFFCEWDPHAPIAPWPEGESTESRRERLARELEASTGPSVGIEKLAAIHLTTPDPGSTAQVWNAITGTSGMAAPGVGLVVEAGDELRIAALVFQVRDLDRARDFLDAQKLPGDNHREVLWLSRDHATGLCIGLTG